MNQDWNEMQTMWKLTNPDGPNSIEILRYVVNRAENFHRQMQRQYRAAWLSAALGLTAITYLLSKVETRVEFTFGLSMTAFLLGVTLHLWFKRRSTRPVDRSLSQPLFMAALEQNFATQIRYLQTMKYWFALPLLATGSATLIGFLAGDAGKRDFYFFPLVLAGTALAWWLNETIAIKGIQDEWQQIRQSLEEPLS